MEIFAIMKVRRILFAGVLSVCILCACASAQPSEANKPSPVAAPEGTVALYDGVIVKDARYRPFMASRGK